MTGQAPLYTRALGVATTRLAEPLRVLHGFEEAGRFAGRASVVRGSNPLAYLVAAILGFPPAAADCAVEVEMTRSPEGVETWRRTFDGCSFASTQELGRGRWAGLVVERFGPVAIGLEVSERGGELHLSPRGWAVFGLPMPRWLGPRATAFEHAAQGRFNFDVALSLPVIGLLVHYRGWLQPVAGAEPAAKA